MTLSRDSIEWSIEFIEKHSDGDLFPKIRELHAIYDRKDDFVALVEGKPLTSFQPKPCRRFIVPKDEISYRQATQLHPQDSILLSALVYQFGKGIEDRRLNSNQVFSYRFSPTMEEGLYNSKTAWNAFWTTAYRKSQNSSYILYCDIADFYNQIYHHAVENQLIASGFPNQAIQWVISLLESTTAGVSRGVPIGPHAVHLIAEATLIPIDNSMSTNGFQFLRYADDIIIFCDSKKEANSALSSLASILDKQQRLTLQRHKTKFYTPTEFQAICSGMIEDRPIDRSEEKLLGIIFKYTGGNPYQSISYNSISPEDWKQFSDKVVRKIINDYLSRDEVDYIRLRWFYRRLAQVGHPGALDISIEQFEKLGPCLANICSYIASIQSIEPEEWKVIGEKLIALLDTEEIAGSEFFRLSILSLFARNKHINHFASLVSRYQSSDPFARREILLAAYQNGAFDWLREHKESYNQMDAWQKMAVIYGASGLPRDEKKYFINMLQHDGPYETVLAKWSRST
ncbi:reverse transcriptase domain-containing protein [uncultured Desulfuromonas sp.]|uniref:RNA-directed DNA polymerase n=1 Tax=uncultured Desulfuromonas sp. TaxID=181013 RepID=UPI002AABC89C|nr:reverse transcriptase domain-containing protein [uncultured Desulfuromonas sp.]